jgi:hypothetical protein
MASKDFALPDGLEALLQQVCAERSVPERHHDELRSMLMRFPGSWPACCHGKCDPCVDDQARIANEVLARWNT